MSQHHSMHKVGFGNSPYLANDAVKEDHRSISHKFSYVCCNAINLCWCSLA